MPIFDIYDDRTPRRVKIDADRITIGRTAENDVIIDERRSSRQHCEIRLQPGEGYILCDLHSRNGTYLNQNRITSPTSLRDGDEIGIGKSSIRFWSSMAEMLAPRLPMVVKKEPPKTASPASPGGKAKPAKKHPVAISLPETIALPDDTGMRASDEEDSNLTWDYQLKLEEPEQAHLPVQQSFTGPLTLNNIMPLNYEGRPAHPAGKDASEVSQAMLRLKQILLKSFQFYATDIHIEPKEINLDIRYRIDGYLHPGGTLETATARSVYSIVKLLCNLNINKKNIMQDGSFAVRLPDRRVDLRVSIAPSTLGDKMVIRILDKNLAPKGLDSLGMDSYLLEQIRQRAFKESSMIVVCGPTGSGKTTTVYAIIQEMNALNKNIVTVEDPVEYKLENVTQIQVNPRFNVTFASALASLLRQDPDVILIGEIRDPDTAKIAIQSAMTGHLVLSTVHARDSIGCIFRLLHLGVEPFLLGSALTAILSQRLLRTLCSLCKIKVKPAARDIMRAGLDELAGTALYAAVGCEHCLGIGYKGRLAIFEMLAITDQIRDAIANRPTFPQLRAAAGDWIFQTLREDAIKKLKNGQTSMEEFEQIITKE